jgi:putative transposase
MEEKNVTYRTRVHYIMPSQELINEARLSNNLYNQALYILRQAFTNEEKLPSKFDLVKTLRHKEYECEEYNNFSKMVSCNAEAIIHLAAQNFKAFLMALRAFKKNKSGFTGAPRIPSYNKKEQEFMVIIRDSQCTVKEGMMRFPGKLNLDKIYVGDLDIAHVRIFPGKKKYKVEVVYKVEALPKRKKGNIAGIDLGLDNLATVAINKRGIRPLLINGRPLKSMNLYFNNKRDKVQSELKKCNDRYMSSRLETLYRKRNNRFNTYMHKASKKIIDYCLEHNVKQIIIGHNKLQKQESKLKNFVAIPIFRLIELIKYKAEYQGIEVIETEESYTSITSYLDKEEPIKDNANKAHRIHRGLFKSNKNKIINADVNSAYQIMKKVIGDKVIKPIGKGALFIPKKITIA